MLTHKEETINLENHKKKKNVERGIHKSIKPV